MEEQRSAARFGAVITSGPQSWQVLQQEGGKAAVRLEGDCFLEQAHENARVSVRAVQEDTLRPVLAWSRAEQTPDGKWSAEMTLPVGGPYQIESKLDAVVDGQDTDFRGDIACHVYVGDLYAIAGQSNAVGFGREAVCDAPQMGVHVLKGNGCWDIASHPIGDTTGLLRPVNRDRTTPGHSPWLAFAKEVRQRTGMPIGLIPTALGGSALCEWDHRGGALYDNMLDIIRAAGGKLRGILWYQGCADAYEGRFVDYLERFMRFVKNTREDLGQPALPVLTVQLNCFVNPLEEPNDIGWASVREAQRRAAAEDGQIFVVPAMDGATTDGIHNSSPANMTIGMRVAQAALGHIYGMDVLGDAPDVAGIRREGTNALVVQFQNVAGKLRYLDRIPPFHIEDDLGDARLCSYEAAESEIRLTAERDFKGKVFVSYQDRKNPDKLCVFDSETMLPALGFYRVEAR